MRLLMKCILISWFVFSGCGDGVVDDVENNNQYNELNSASLDSFTVSTLNSMKSSVRTYLGKPFINSWGIIGNTIYYSFTPNTSASPWPDDWKRWTRNHPQENIAALAYAHLGKCDKAKGMIRSFFVKQAQDGGYPYNAKYDESAYQTLGSESQVAAPILAWEALRVFEICGSSDSGFLQDAWNSSVRNIAWWENGAAGRLFRDGPCTGLYHWNHILESVRDGEEYNRMPKVPTWAATDDIANQCATDLNSYIVGNYRAVARMGAILGQANDYGNRAQNMSQHMRELMWDEGNTFFFGVDNRNGSKVWVKDIGGWMALFGSVATQDQADKMVSAHLTPANGAFHSSYGMPSLEKGYSSQWGNYGSHYHWSGAFWPGLSTLVVDGLVRYGKFADAQRMVFPFAREVANAGPDGGYPEWYDAESGRIYDGTDLCNYITMSAVLPMAKMAWPSWESSGSSGGTTTPLSGRASIVSENPQDGTSIVAGASFLKKWDVRISPYKPDEWDLQYVSGFGSGSVPSKIKLGNGLLRFEIWLKAPTTPGNKRRSTWKAVHKPSGGGTTLWAEINVVR